MKGKIKSVHFERKNNKPQKATNNFGLDAAKKAIAFHKTFPEYAPTPLEELKELAVSLGVKGLYIKDESFRFGLNAFKGLGGSYCIGTYAAQVLDTDIAELSYGRILQEKDRLGEITFVTATDGNHGRGIAWTANKLGFKSVVYMPKGSAEERLSNIKALGADASITDMNYDDTVRFAAEMAEKNGWVLVQDTAWEGYTDIPKWIMQGYITMAYEALEQLGNKRPTHIFLQAGVGAMSGAVTAFFADAYPGDDKPIITVVEPDQADCLYRTTSANDGKLHSVSGDMNTIMAGLACGEPCTIGYEMLNAYAENFVSMPDNIAAKGMRVLGNPLGADRRIVSGESGAAPLGLVVEVLQNESLAWLKEQLQLDENSVILCFSTEGDTDKENYRKIVWDGAYANADE